MGDARPQAHSVNVITNCMVEWTWILGAIPPSPPNHGQDHLPMCVSNRKVLVRKVVH